MSLNFISGLLHPTDPARLHAELWVDYAAKVMSCYLPIVLGTVVMARDLFGSSIQCFYLNLADTQLTRNATSANGTNDLPRMVFDNLGAYSRQLAEFVNVYCETKEYFSGNSIFSYRLFALLLGIQAAILYIPTLVWNITTARKIICNLRFIVHDMEMLYKCFRGEWRIERGEYKQKELRAILEEWSERNSLHKKYVFKQIASMAITILFFLLFFYYEFVNIAQIYGEFPCDVNKKFTVDCTVPSASIYRCVWGSNMALLCLSFVIMLYNAFIQLCFIEDRPFKKLGINLEHKISPNDCHMMYAFFQANVEAIDKFNYLKVLDKCGILQETTV
ncbi:PREDICTED: uncharacterized protein LOC109461872 isoform X2 [Branchiostoma belcheri]|nr:PREDICTED: uncharacterized protein LOC109461872 isoform X2 [Branchiostoma belcheri]